MTITVINWSTASDEERDRVLARLHGHDTARGPMKLGSLQSVEDPAARGAGVDPDETGEQHAARSGKCPEPNVQSGAGATRRQPDGATTELLDPLCARTCLYSGTPIGQLTPFGPWLQ